MEYSNIQSLLDRYFDGESTLAEEKMLREYFSGNAIAQDHQVYAPLFNSFTKASTIAYDRDFEVPLKKTPLKYIAGIAAVAIVSLALWVPSFSSNSDISTNYASDEMAILKTKQALGVMSHMISNSATKLEVVEEFDKASSTLFK